MAEWLKAAVLKTVNGVTRSGVRIPLPPPVIIIRAVCIKPLGISISYGVRKLNFSNRSRSDIRNSPAFQEVGPKKPKPAWKTTIPIWHGRPVAPIGELFASGFTCGRSLT